MDPIVNGYPSVPFGDLRWCHNHGIAYQSDMTKSVEYGKDYFEKYVRYEKTEISLRLNQGRVAITEKYCNSILDIGIGSGEFIKESNVRIFGYDINPIAIRWLKEHGIYIDPYVKIPDVNGLTFWDTLEHIPNPNLLLSAVKSGQYIFISIPVFKDLLYVRSSKHYRPNEHYYYFTTDGLLKYMDDSLFNLVEVDDFETRSGREDILTFVFVKRDH